MIVTRSGVLVYEAREGVALLRLDRPEKLNAIDSQMVAELRSAIETVRGDGSVRAVVVTGSGRAFSAGADVSELAELGAAADFLRFLDDIQTTFTALESLPVPVIAALNGLAYGGGLELALACDLRVMAEDATLGLPEIRLGLLPGAGGTQRLPRMIPPAIAKEMLYLGEAIAADVALRLGLVNAVAPRENVLEVALARAQRIATLPPLAIRSAKVLARIATEAELPGGLAAERQTVAFPFGTEDRREGLAAHRAHRPARFTGR